MRGLLQANCNPVEVVIGTLADAKVEVADSAERIVELELLLSMKDSLVRRGEAYYEINNTGVDKGGPYCMRCWEIENKTVP